MMQSVVTTAPAAQVAESESELANLITGAAIRAVYRGSLATFRLIRAMTHLERRGARSDAP